MPETDANNFLEVLKYVGGFIGGFAASIIQRKFDNKETVLKKRVFTQQLGFSVESQDWGNIQILYNDKPSNNLYTLTVEIINDSSKDFSNLTVEISVPLDCTIYRHFGQLWYDDLIKDLSLKNDFYTYLEDVRLRYNSLRDNNQIIPEELNKEVAFVTRHRKFELPVFNRKTKSVFHFLVENLDNEEPSINVSILEPGIRITTFQEEAKQKELKKKWTEIISVLLFILLSYPIYKYSPNILTSVLLMISNLFIGSFLAIGIYQLVRWAKKYFLS
jgi:hypothetical protein